MPMPTNGFNGFQGLIKNPTYDVKTPQSLYDLSIRAMKLVDEEILKGSIKNPDNDASMLDHINKVIYNTIENKDDYPELSSFKSFLKNITVADREALLIALYHATYGGIMEYNLTCPSRTCRHQYKTNISINDGFSIEWYESKNGENLLKEYSGKEYNLPSSKAILFAVSPITLEKEYETSKILNDIADTIKLLIMRLNYIRFNEDGTEIDTYQNMQIKMNKLEDTYKSKIDKSGTDEEKEKLEKEKGKKLKELKDSINKTHLLDTIQDLNIAVSDLLSQDKMRINEIFEKDIDIYSPLLKYQSTCPKCGHSFNFDINYTNELFRMVFQS